MIITYSCNEILDLEDLGQTDQVMLYGSGGSEGRD